VNSITHLKELYAKNSKHSNYQILSEKLAHIIGDNQIEVHSRYERERLDYILKNVNVKGKNILDIGGNSGFFTFEVMEEGARNVHYYEGNKEHSDFVKVAASVLRCTDKIEVTNNYYNFELNEGKKYDVTFLLNVLHHLGDDYGDNSLSIDVAKQQMMMQLNSMAHRTRCLVFQLGFCWKGNRHIGLFSNGTKKELIDFVTSSVRGTWVIEKIGIPVKNGENITYVDLDEKNIVRDDSLGEFLNRPLFVMKSMLSV
jgi:hypothetical protein